MSQGYQWPSEGPWGMGLAPGRCVRATVSLGIFAPCTVSLLRTEPRGESSAQPQEQHREGVCQMAFNAIKVLKTIWEALAPQMSSKYQSLLGCLLK